MSSFDWKKTEDPIKGGVAITATTTETFFGLRATNVKHITRYYGYYQTCQWDMWKRIRKTLSNLQKMNQGVRGQNKILLSLGAIK